MDLSTEAPIEKWQDQPLKSQGVIFTRCQRDRCVVNRGEGLTTIDFSGGDAATTGAISRSEGQREKRAVVALLSFDSENELIADGVGKVPLLVGADTTVVVQKEDGLVQKNTSVEELRKPTH
ncbi:hypothetical protein B296_00055411 [Ensete ventricosum]|uniref:Uncharacterized protein n=1 Tax=Ensete ventricosum TaxID=4639 RepID=A0A426XRR4_ENSVE|nr:hypothetical protein B296_00055411 [Ensete ventricosum]